MPIQIGIIDQIEEEKNIVIKEEKTGDKQINEEEASQEEFQED